MKPPRPIGHIVGDLGYLAIAVVYRMRQATTGQPCHCWVDDDGCVYLSAATNPRAIAMQRHAPEQRVNTYRRSPGGEFPLTTSDVIADLREAAVAYATRSVRHAQPEAQCA